MCARAALTHQIKYGKKGSASPPFMAIHADPNNGLAKLRRPLPGCEDNPLMMFWHAEYNSEVNMVAAFEKERCIPAARFELAATCIRNTHHPQCP